MRQHYFLLAAQVIYQKDKLERSRNFNILITSEHPFVNRAQLGRAQQQAQVRYFTEFDADQRSTVVDVFIQSVSNLGEMTEAEFHAGFNYPGKPEPEPTEGEPVEDEPMAETSVEDVTKDDA